MEWNVAQARQRLSELLRAAEREPQKVYNRSRLVAAVVDAETFDEFRRWREKKGVPSVAEKLAELREICAEEGGWELPSSPRRDRPNAFAEALDDVLE